MDPRRFLKDHLDSVLDSHFLKGLFALEIVFLVDFVQMFDFFAAFVLLLQVAHVAFNLLLALLDARFDLARHLPRLFVFQPVDLSQSLFVVAVRPSDGLSQQLLSYRAHLLHFLDFLRVA